jgi:glucose-6-phosphate 1-dehydrogenase
MRGDQVEAAWELLMPILTTWQKKEKFKLPELSRDAWGPEIAEALIAKDGFSLVYVAVEE